MVSVVSPVVVPLGESVHLTFTNQNGNVVPADDGSVYHVIPEQFASPPMPVAAVGLVYDADGRGVTITGVKVGSGWAQVEAVNGNVRLLSTHFLVSVPWNVTAVGTVSP